VTLADAQQHRLLELLRDAGKEPVAFAELHADGIGFPAAVVSELELNGYLIERVYEHGRLVGVRLLDSEPRDTPAAHRRRRRPWPHRGPAPPVTASLVPGDVADLDLGAGRDADEAEPSLSRPTRSRRRAPRPGMSLVVGRRSSPSQRPPAA
jgi:hypothetical protein